ncbi:hypothetical protein DY000_02006317 [Brassica cretica]|uniref:RNase H type-1 domain-containing protein n=1 Tax=Brassica cretica TaxID=69181 RepID=A0ABQ7CDX4_BRACR|nr:hypothetical protein DY000_02006317 [Brassica cretica]
MTTAGVIQIMAYTQSKQEQGVPESLTFRVPWILWCLWKARNDKVFNGKDVFPLDTLQLASSEADIWKPAQITPMIQEEEATNRTPTEYERTGPHCKVDAFWQKHALFFGGGFSLKDGEGRDFSGSFASNQTISPIQAEFRTWSMNSTLLLGFQAMSFESDCHQLVKLLNNEEMEE